MFTDPKLTIIWFFNFYKLQVWMEVKQKKKRESERLLIGWKPNGIPVCFCSHFLKICHKKELWVPSWSLFTEHWTEWQHKVLRDLGERDDAPYGCERCLSEHSASWALSWKYSPANMQSPQDTSKSCSTHYFCTHFCILFLHFDFPFSAAIFKVGSAESELLKKRNYWPVWRRPTFRFNLIWASELLELESQCSNG